MSVLQITQSGEAIAGAPVEMQQEGTAFAAGTDYMSMRGTAHVAGSSTNSWIARKYSAAPVQRVTYAAQLVDGLGGE